jgi:hypothetical protein
VLEYEVEIGALLVGDILVLVLEVVVDFRI